MPLRKIVSPFLGKDILGKRKLREKVRSTIPAFKALRKAESASVKRDVRRSKFGTIRSLPKEDKRRSNFDQSIARRIVERVGLGGAVGAVGRKFGRKVLVGSKDIFRAERKRRIGTQEKNQILKSLRERRKR